MDNQHCVQTASCQVVTYNTLTNVLGSSTEWPRVGFISSVRVMSQVLGLLAQMLNEADGSRRRCELHIWGQGLRPNAITINSIGGRLEGETKRFWGEVSVSAGVLSLCADMAVRPPTVPKSCFFRPDVVLCNTMLDRCQRALRWKEAIMMLQDGTEIA